VDAVSGQTVSVPQTDSGTVAFSFPTPILSGSGYRVSVATQPIGLDQTCTVAGGGGTVASASITNIAVTCLTNVYGVSGTIGGPAAHSTTGLVLTETVTGTQAVITGNSFTFPFPNGGIPDGSSFHISLEELESEQSNVTAHCLLDGTGANGTIAGGNFTRVSVTCRFISSGLAGIGTGSQTAPGNVYFFGFDPVGGRVHLNSSSPTSDAAPTSLVSGSRGFSSDPAAYEYAAPVYVANQIRGTITPFLITCQFNESEEFPGEDCSQGPAAGQDVAVPTGAAILATDPTGKNLYSTSGVFDNEGNTEISAFALDSLGNLANRVDTSFPGYAGWLTYNTPLPKILFNSTDERVLFLPLNSGSDQLDDGIFSGFDVSLFKRSNSNGALTPENISAAISAAGLSSDGTGDPSLVPVDAVANAKNLYVAAETLIRDSGIGDPPFPGAAPSIVAYALTASGLSLLPGSPYRIPNAAVDSESAILLDPSGTYLFLVTSSGISTFVVNVDGSLTLTAGSPIETVGVLGLSQPIIDPSGRFLYAAAVNTNNIFAYSINRQPTAASPALSVIGIYPTGQSGQLLVDNSGKFLYYLISTSSSEILGYFIDPRDHCARPLAAPTPSATSSASWLHCPPIRLSCTGTTIAIISADLRVGQAVPTTIPPSCFVPSPAVHCRAGVGGAKRRWHHVWRCDRAHDATVGAIASTRCPTRNPMFARRTPAPILRRVPIAAVFRQPGAPDSDAHCERIAAAEDSWLREAGRMP
jgi:hypothetical protein